MSSGPVATAFVKVLPDTSDFRRQLQVAVNKAVADVTVPPIRAAVQTSAAGATAAAAAGIRGGSGQASTSAARGVRDLTNESNFLRGSLIGLSRVTPVTVFGLGLYGTAAIAAGYAIKGAIRSTADFEHQLNVFQATTGATGEEMDRVAAKAKALGADLSLPSTSAGDAALAMTELAKAGLSVNDALAGSTGVLQLAAAAQLDVGSAAEFVATELNAFGLAGKEATHVADLLAGASIAAQGDIRDFGTAFQQVSAVSRQVNLDIETTTGALTELAKAGLRGADGGTSLRTTLLRLAPTTKQAAQYQEALGIKIDKTVAIGKQLPDLIDQYRAALSALTPVQQQQALAQIFGQDAIRAASILIRGGSQALEENTKAADQNGAANRLAQANAKGLSGAFNGLKSNADTLGITVGGFVKGPLTDLVTVLSEAVGATDKLVTAFAGLKTPDFLGGKKTDKIATEITKGLLFFPLVKDTFFPDGKAEPSIDELLKGGRGGSTFTGPLESLTAAEKAAVRARITRLNEDKKKRKPLPADTNAPNALEIGVLNAQLNDNLQQELRADRAVEHYFEERKKLAVVGTARYKAILGAQEQAHSAAAAVQSQINSESAAAAAKTKALRDQNTADRKREAKEAAQAAADVFNLQKSEFDLRIQQATTLHPDDKGLATSAYNAEIRFLSQRIKQLQGIRKKTVEQKQEIVNLKGDVVALRGAILDLGAASNGGFSLNDLFQEAVNQLNEFGSNVSASITTGGAARAAVAGGVLAQQQGLTPGDKAHLSQVATTNDLLADILVAVRGNDRADGGASGSASATHAGAPVGAFTAQRARALAGQVRGN